MAQQTSDETAYGGVNPQPCAPSLSGAQATAAPSGTGAFPGFVSHGGPVIISPQIYSGFWGALWSDADHQARAARLNQFLSDLAQSRFMNVLSQYGVGAASFIQSGFVGNVPNMLADSDIQQIIQSQIDAGTIPEPSQPSNIAYILFLDETIGVQDDGIGIVMCEPTSDNAFGYHKFFTTSAGNPFYYAVVPALDDTCLTNTCGDDANCSLHLAQTQEQRQTQVTSHEFAEMVTDPELNAWFDPFNGENGDICNGTSAVIAVGGNSWTVQSTYSKSTDDQTNGQTFCLSEAPEPIPPL